MSVRDTLVTIVRSWAEQHEALEETPEAVVDAYKAEVLREAADMITDPANWTKYGFSKGTMKFYMVAVRIVARMLDPGRER